MLNGIVRRDNAFAAVTWSSRIDYRLSTLEGDDNIQQYRVFTHKFADSSLGFEINHISNTMKIKRDSQQRKRLQ